MVVRPGIIAVFDCSRVKVKEPRLVDVLCGRASDEAKGRSGPKETDAGNA